MRMAHLTAGIVLAVTLLLDKSGLASQEQRFDLTATTASTDAPIIVQPGKLMVEIFNKAPAARYRINWQITSQTVPPLQWPSADKSDARTKCDSVKTIAAELAEMKEEEGIADLKELLEDLMDDCNDPGRAADERAAREVIEKTKQSSEVTLDPGAELHLTIVRHDGNKDLKRWEVTYRAASSGDWFASYGFTFLPSRDDAFYSRNRGDGSFAIEHQNDNDDFAFVPSVFYSWAPAKLSPVNFSITGGLGFDLSSPVVFLGGAVTVYKNLSLVAGAAMHEQVRLNGHYAPGDTLSENLTEDQLTEETFAPNVFFGLSFRFGTAPASHKLPTSVVSKEAEEPSDDKKGNGDKEQTPKSTDAGKRGKRR